MPTDIELKIGLSDSDKATMKTQISSDVLNEIVNGEVNVSGSKTNLTKLKASVDEAVGSIENKVEPDDICPELRAGYAFTADNLNATKGLTVNDDPMSFGAVGGAQKSAVGDGNASLNKLVCVDVVRNQHVIRFDSSTRDQFTASYDGASGILTLTRNSNPLRDNYAGQGIMDAPVVKGHYCLALMEVKLTTSTSANYGFNVFPSYVSFKYMRLANGEWMSYKAISLISLDTTSPAFCTQLFDANALAQGDTIQYRNVRLIDLTQRYGSNDVVNAIIGSGKSDEQVERLLAFDPEILSDTAHDAGTLVPSKSAKLVSKDEDGKVLGTIALPNYEGHGILKVVDGKVVADGDELYPDGKGKKRYGIIDLGTLNWNYASSSSNPYFEASVNNPAVANAGELICTKYTNGKQYGWANLPNKYIRSGYGFVRIVDNDYTDTTAFKASMSGVYLVYELATEQDISTPVYQSTFPVEQGGTLQFLDENDKPIAGLQGSEVFYQKNIKAFVEALGEATDWNPERIKRLGSLSFTPEYVNIALSPSPTGAYARAQVYNATFTIVISAPLTGTANGSITFQDSEVDLSNFQTKPAEAIYDMDGKKVSEEPTTADCNIASFVGRSKGGTIMWSLLHSGVNKVKVHIEEAVPLDSDGKGKIDCRASLIL